LKKILFVAAHRKGRAPAQRFRFEQYLDFLEASGYQCEISNIISKEDDPIFYAKGISLQKILIGVKAWVKRFQDTWRMNNYDIIFISREAFITGSTFFEKRFRRSRAKIVFDIDDAIWINTISENNRALAWLKNANKTATIVKLADLVFAGNEYLASYCRQHNNNVVIVPTTIDTDSYRPQYNKRTDKIIIGWSGSFTTIEHFSYAIPALKILKEKYGDRIGIKVIGDGSYVNEELNIKGLPWKENTEINDLQEIHIGIMPLPDTSWTWGKCGLKGLQYMALEIPTVMSAVGVNKDIIQDGVNGFLATSVTEWVDKISKLVEDQNLRVTLGKAGRKTVVEKFSTASEKDHYKSLFDNLISK
jgi:glycosyltransferase involved in cell wall biosynthesis